MEPSRSTHTLAIAPASKLLWYEIRSVLGQGGFGITYLARDTNLDQDVAVKEYLPSSFASRDSDGRIKALTPEHEADYDWGLERFIDEGRTLARFDHPGIVRVLSVFEENSTAYLVMRYEKGEPMSAVLQRQGTIAEGPLKRIVIEILEGLKQVHDAGFIHRDIKPANIYLRENGSAVLIDFGAARQALGIQTQTLTTIVSPGYAPFEQYYSDGTAQGPWTDIYALGATAYRAISGKAPLAAVDRSQRILAGGDDSLVTATELGTGNYSAQFLRAVDQALAFRDAERPQSIADWREMLTRAPDSEAGRASTQVETEKTAERVDGDNTDSALQTTKVLGNESSEAPTIAVGTPPGNFRVQPPTKKRFNKKLLAVAVIAIIAVLIVARKNVEPAPSESAV
ncbi:MAG: serine/threonine-protein kinase, partial [Gammaproteobacteria bacterium]|nr:serine/threonine-protein kinase [Gammaproteobacteria bacterium]